MTTGYIDQRLSLRVASGFVGGPEFKTNIQSLNSGRDNRNKEWRYPKHRYTANLAVFSEEEREELRALFYVCAGMWGAFRFRDAVDYKANNELLSVAAGTTTPVQLIKSYTFGPATATRLIQAPDAESFVMLDSDGVTPIAGTLDAGTGIFTPAAAWPHSTALWSGRYDVWTRFNSDYNAFTAVRTDLGTADIELIEAPI